ncbi:hypothetical protein AAE478_001063 [Parahypoxylon ruwenzoriense]
MKIDKEVYKDFAHVHEHLKKHHYAMNKIPSGHNMLGHDIQAKIKDLFAPKTRKMPIEEKWNKLIQLCKPNLGTALAPGPYFVDIQTLLAFLDNPPVLPANDLISVSAVQPHFNRVLQLAMLYGSGHAAGSQNPPHTEIIIDNPGSYGDGLDDMISFPADAQAGSLTDLDQYAHSYRYSGGVSPASLSLPSGGYGVIE